MEINVILLMLSMMSIIIAAGITTIAAIVNYRLTDNVEKFNHGTLTINLQDKLSAVTLQ